jgi:hypothetical protein
LVRRWAISTRPGVLDAGDRGSEYSNAVIHENTLVFGTRGAGLVSIYPNINQQRWVLPISGGVVSELSIADCQRRTRFPDHVG